MPEPQERPPPKQQRPDARGARGRGGPRPPFQVARTAEGERHHNTLELLAPFEPSV